MIKKELKSNFKGFLLWTLILLGIFLVVYLIYPYIVTDEAMKNLDDMVRTFPPELLKAFNMDLTSINTAFGWLKSEGYMFILLITGFYSSYLGYNILLREEYEKTSEYLGFVPITRNRILTNKIIVSLIYIFGMLLIFCIFNIIALSISGDFDMKELILLSVTPVLASLPLFSINLFISTLINRPKKNVGISLGLVLLFYFLNMLSGLSENVEFLKYFSIYTLCDTRNIISKAEMNPILIIISVSITVLFIFGSYYKYNKKELI